MDQAQHVILNFLTHLNIASVFRAVVIVIVGFLFAKLLDKGLERVSKKFAVAHLTALWRRIIYYLIIVLFLFSSLHELGFNLHILLGAAGVFTVAFGFASQTSASNLISGLFLSGERPFVVGDTISVGDTKGEVLSIDLLSTKLRTPENTLVRIPNEVLLKTQIVNLSRFPVRRLDSHLAVSNQEDMEKITSILLNLAAQHVLCLKEPEPSVIVLGFGDSAINLRFSVWVSQTDFSAMESEIYRAIKLAFDRNHIEAPFLTRAILLRQPEDR